MKNIGQYNQDLSVPRKKDIDSLETRVKTNEDNIAMAESDIEGLNTDVGTLKTDVNGVKTALSSKQDTIVGAASTIVEDNLTAGKVLVSDASGKVGVASVGINDINPVGKYLKLTGGTLTGSLVLEDEEAQIKIGEAGVIFNPSHNEPQIVISDSNYATQYISLSSSQTKIVSGTQFTNTNMTLAPDGITIQKIESGVPSTATLSGISNGVNANDAVNLSQLNSSLGNYVSKTDTNDQTIASSFEATNSIKAQTGGEVNNTIRLLSSDVEPSIEATSGGSRMSISLVPQYNEVSFNADDNVTLTGIKAGTNDTDAVNVSQLNEVKKSIPSSSNFVKKTGDTMTGSLTVNGNIAVSTVNYPKLIVRPTASGAGEGFMESSGHSTSVVARNVVGNNSNSRTLLIKDSVNAVTLDGAIQLVDRVSNTSKYYNIIHAGNIANYGGQIVSVISDTGGTFTYLGSITSKLYYYKFTSQYNLPNNAILLDISIPYSSTIGVFKVMCSYIQNYTPATIWFMSMNYVTDFTHDSSTKIYYIAT